MQEEILLLLQVGLQLYLLMAIVILLLLQQVVLEQQAQMLHLMQPIMPVAEAVEVVIML